MKKFKTILAAMMLVASVSMVSCKDNKKEVEAETETTIENQGKEYTSAYVCPMHCEDSGSDKEGKCGSCGMTLVKNEDHTANGHKHD